MSDNWQPGDLALCVRGGYLSGLPVGPFPEAGAIHEVLGVADYGLLGLWLLVDGAPDNVDDQRNWGPLWDSARFRKIHPLNEAEHAAAMRELNVPVREPVT